MRDHLKGAGEDPARTTHDEDDRQQVAVLRLLLEHHPATLTLAELVREMTGGGSRDFSDFDAVHRAVGELAASGLLHRPGIEEMVRPTRASLRFYDLWER